MIILLIIMDDENPHIFFAMLLTNYYQKNESIIRIEYTFSTLGFFIVRNSLVMSSKCDHSFSLLGG